MTIIAVNEPSKNSQSVEHMTPIMHNSVPVITTELLADVYETDINNIQQNFKRNKDRFTEGKHYFKLTGLILREFKNRLTNCQSVNKHARNLILWTERGAARHAKMLDTDKAWDVFGKLEDFYFNLKEPEPKTTTHDRTPLRGLVNTLMGKYGISDRKLFQMVHREFGVNHIDELNHDQLPSAIAYLATKVIEGEFLGQEALPVSQQIDLSFELSNVNALYKNIMYFKEIWETFNPHFTVLTPDIAEAFNGAFCNVCGPITILRNRLERRFAC
ncbi:ORF6N domain-containing protein [Xenorhabdus stockiae]|uniref:ORF6N domain-containing protein n=1 Tax=Xenorhabdus stockiae TaxID=351614 RepID=UPI003CEFB51D